MICHLLHIYITLYAYLKTGGEPLHIFVNATVTSQQEKSGVATFATNLLKAMKELPADNCYDVMTIYDPDLACLKSPCFSVRSFPAIFHQLPLKFSWLCWYIWQYTGLNRQLGLIKPDVYLSFDFNLPSYNKCTKACMVYDLTPLLLEDAYPEHFRVRFRLQVADAVKNADRIITISQSAKKDIMAYFNAEPGRIEVIYPGFDNHIYKAEKNIKADKMVLERNGIVHPYILFLGAFEPKKNIPRLIEAFEKVKKNGSVPHRLVLGGKRSWHDKEVFDKIAGSPFRNEIDYIGYVPYPDLPALMRNADLFVFPSLNEGFGMPVLEAMACGTPVITSRISSLPEVAGDAGILVDPYDTDDMAEAMYRIVVDGSKREQMRCKGLERSGQFSWRRSAELVLSVLADISRS